MLKASFRLLDKIGKASFDCGIGPKEKEANWFVGLPLGNNRASVEGHGKSRPSEAYSCSSPGRTEKNHYVPREKVVSSSSRNYTADHQGVPVSMKSWQGQRAMCIRTS